MAHLLRQLTGRQQHQGQRPLGLAGGAMAPRHQQLQRDSLGSGTREYTKHVRRQRCGMIDPRVQCTATQCGGAAPPTHPPILGLPTCAAGSK